VAITALPTPPSRQDPANFAIRADTFLGALPNFGSEANALALEMSTTAASAAASASNAATSATQSAASASQSASSAAAAASSFDAFDDRYLGSKTTNPAVDNDGNTLIVGAIYWNSSANEMRVWTGSLWAPVQTTSASTAAATSATSAANSATSAATSATNAANSATAASTSASNAATSATSAAASATSAANSFDSFDDRYLGAKSSNPSLDNDNQTLLIGALYWNTSANEIRVWSGSSWVAVQTTSAAVAAANSATNAANSATAASTSATSAATSATNAANSATAASTSASNAATSATSAAASAVAAADSFDSFDDRYLGAKSSNPSLDNDNQTLLIGAMYWNNSVREMRVWSGSQWLPVQTTSAAESAAASAAAASASANAAASSLDAFDDRYLGSKTSAPTADNDGNPLLTGALYWNNSGSQLYVWTGSNWDLAAFNASNIVKTFNGRNGTVSLTKADVEAAAYVFSSVSQSNTAVLRDANQNFSGNVISAVDFNSTSDGSLKTDIVSLNNNENLDKLNNSLSKLNPVEFTWKNSGKKSYGLIAQEVELVFPELVVQREEGIKGVNYIPIISMLLAKVQELSSRLDKLEK
jgi:hypothetical protein